VLGFLFYIIMDKRRDQYIERANLAPMEKKIRILQLIEKQGIIKNNYLQRAKTIESVTKVLTEVYKDEWDIVFRRGTIEGEGAWLTKDRRYWIAVDIVIRLPKYMITNSNGDKHWIHDHFIKLVYTSSSKGGTFYGFEAKRMAATKKEISSGYQHSHQSGRKYTYNVNRNKDSALRFRGFCLGSSEIQQVLTILSSTYTPEVFKLFLFQLDEYIRWESVEGGPHKHMHNLGGGKLPSRSTSAMYDFWRALKIGIDDFPGGRKEIDFTLQRGQVRVVDNAKYEDFLKYLGDDPDNYGSNDVATRNDKGDYVRRFSAPGTFPPSLLSPPDELADASFLFRGELIEFRIIEEEGTNGSVFYVHNQIKEYVTEKIEQRIKTQRFRSHITSKLNPPRDATKDSGPDRVLVPQQS
jgi:hypothetical protein